MTPQQLQSSRGLLGRYFQVKSIKFKSTDITCRNINMNIANSAAARAVVDRLEPRVKVRRSQRVNNPTDAEQTSGSTTATFDSRYNITLTYGW
jgi:hypothetical protein